MYSLSIVERLLLWLGLFFSRVFYLPVSLYAFCWKCSIRSSLLSSFTTASSTPISLWNRLLMFSFTLSRCYYSNFLSNLFYWFCILFFMAAIPLGVNFFPFSSIPVSIWFCHSVIFFYVSSSYCRSFFSFLFSRVSLAVRRVLTSDSFRVSLVCYIGDSYNSTD